MCRDGEGWEKIKVLRYNPGREHEYDIKYLWSENPQHQSGGDVEFDEWEEIDFKSCYRVDTVTDPIVNDDAEMPSEMERAALRCTPEELATERSSCVPLSERCRGARLVGRILWAPPQNVPEVVRCFFFLSTFLLLFMVNMFVF